MGELFRQARPETAFPWTGERFVAGDAGIGGDGRIEIEHLHRYFLARQLCRGKRVLDVASGEGYGSALLAQTAEQVIGVELDQATVDYAARTYRFANLQYMQGEAVRLPVDSASLDAVVSFETLEHFADHEVFFADVKRVLKPDGFVLVSTPDVSVYSGAGSTPNPYHMRELTTADFLAELRAEFRNVLLLRQRVIVGSAILPDEPSSDAKQTWIFERRDASTFEADSYMQRAPYLLALASNAENPPLAGSLYIYTGELMEPAADVIAMLRGHAAALAEKVKKAEEEGASRLHSRERTYQQEVEAYQRQAAAYQQQAEVYEQQAEAARQDFAQRLLQAETGHANTLAAIQQEFDQRMQQAETRHANTQQEAAQRLIQAEAAHAQTLAEARHQIATLESALAAAQTQAEAIQRQVNTGSLLGHQQELVIQRLSSDLNLRAQQTRESLAWSEEVNRVNKGLTVDLEAARDQIDQLRRANAALQSELADLGRAYSQLSKLIIPVWMRRALPSSLKTPFRVLKRTLRK